MKKIEPINQSELNQRQKKETFSTAKIGDTISVNKTPIVGWWNNGGYSYVDVMIDGEIYCDILVSKKDKGDWGPM